MILNHFLGSFVSAAITGAVSQYSFLTDWADKGLINDDIYTEKYILEPLRNALFNEDPLTYVDDTYHKIKQVVFAILFTIATLLSFTTNTVQHVLSCFQMVCIIPIFRSHYPDLQNDSSIGLIGAGLFNIWLTPLFGALSSFGSIFKTVDVYWKQEEIKAN